MVYFILASVSFFLLLDFKSKFTGNLEFYNFLNPVFTTSTHCFLCFNDLLTLKNCRRRHHKKISVKWERFEILIDLLYCFFSEKVKRILVCLQCFCRRMIQDIGLAMCFAWHSRISAVYLSLKFYHFLHLMKQKATILTIQLRGTTQLYTWTLLTANYLSDTWTLPYNG